MAQAERFFGIRAIVIKKPIFPLARTEAGVFSLADGFVEIANLGEIQLTQTVNGNVAGEAKVEQGTTFEQPGRVPRLKLSSFNGNRPRQPFSLCAGERFILKKGRVTVQVVNRRKYQ